MCGIGGYFLRQGARAPAGIIDKLQGALAHRGPDAAGRYVDDDAGLVHTRLSIVDPAGGDQPFVRKNRAGQRRVLVANGEIYNHTELRRARCAGIDFASDSDCEIIAALIGAFGHEAVRELRGMYAFALYSPESREAVLARDPFGIKPLYYHESVDGVFFASEPAALRAAGLGRATRDDVDSRLHAASIIDRQFARDDIEAFAGIRRLGPGETLVVRDGRIALRHFDRPLEAVKPGDSQADTRQFGLALRESVEAHLMADVPLGLFFSGGVDSASILSCMAGIGAQGGTPGGPGGGTGRLLAYHVRFDRAGDDPGPEAELARALASDAGAEFVDVPYAKADFLANAGRAALCVDDAIADYAVLPTLHLAARAARDVKVVLSGEGGDEFFAGYGRYRAGLRPFGAKFPTRPGPAMRAGIFRREVGETMRRHMEAMSAGMPGLLARLVDRGGALDRLQRHDIADWLPNNLLVKLDRCLMRHGVEGRTPYIDRKLSGYGLGLGADARIRGRAGKWLVKSWLERNMPAARPFAPKRGFTVPVGRWIAEEADRLAPLVAAQPGIGAVIDTSTVPHLFQAAGGRGGLLAWRVLMYAVWHQVHHVGVDAGQPVDQILAARQPG